MIGAQLKQWRELMDFSQQEAADSLGLSLSTYRRQERSPLKAVDRVIELACITLYSKTHHCAWPWY